MNIKTPWLQGKATGIVKIRTAEGDKQHLEGNPIEVTSEDGLSKITDLQTAFSPKQDLNGYDHPWVGGAGKNLCGGLVTTTDTQYGVTYTANSDGTFTVNGTNSAGAIADYRLSGQGSYSLNLPVGDYKLSGGVQGLNGSGNTLYLAISGNGTRYVGNNGTTDSSFSIAEGEYISSVFIRMASGATANNAVFKPMIRLATEADATFEPYENICPISGHTSATVQRTGKNLLNPSLLTVFGQTYIGTINYNTDGSIAVAPSTAYTISFASGIGDGRIFQYDASGNAIGSALQFTSQPYTFTTNANCKTIGFRYKFTNETATVADAKAQLEIGNTATKYEPYSGNTYTINLNGTVYGGTVDLATGVLTVMWRMVDMGSLTWNRQAWNGTYNFVTTGLRTPAIWRGGTSALPNLYCSCYEKVSRTTGYGGKDFSICYANNGANPDVMVRDSHYATANEFKTAVTGQQLVFELEEPLTYTLTAQQISLLTGVNYISTDADNIVADVLHPSWTSLIDPKSLKHDTYDLDAGETTGRNLEGTMLRDRVAVKEKLNMEFPPMVAADYHTMLQLTKGHFFEAKYYSPLQGAYRVAEMYVGDREGNMYGDYDATNPDRQMWTDIKFNFIER